MFKTIEWPSQSLQHRQLRHHTVGASSRHSHSASTTSGTGTTQTQINSGSATLTPSHSHRSILAWLLSISVHITQQHLLDIILRIPVDSAYMLDANSYVLFFLRNALILKYIRRYRELSNEHIENIYYKSHTCKSI